jgi:hypothetical protein
VSGEELRIAIRELLRTHPRVAVSPAGHAAHVERYVTSDGTPIGLEPRTVRFQNLWTRADAVRPRRMADIASRYYRRADFDISKPNHNLFGEPTFKDADLICFKVTDLWQAVRVIGEVADWGGGA